MTRWMVTQAKGLKSRGGAVKWGVIGNVTLKAVGRISSRFVTFPLFFLGLYQYLKSLRYGTE
jgi:hypothetical protein